MGPGGKTEKAKLLRVLTGEAVSPPPVWLMRQAGRYLPEYRETRNEAGSFLDLCYTPELAARVTLQPIERFGFDASILFSDILVIPDALGQKVDFQEGVGPVLEPLQGREDFERLEPGSALKRLAPIFETVRLLREALPGETALIGFCGAPWTVATYMIGGRGSPDQASARGFAYADPGGFQALIDMLVDVSARYLCAQVKAGAQALQIFDSWAGNLPEHEFMRWCVEPNARLVARIRQDAPGVPVIGFPRGAGPLYPVFVKETGVDAVSCDTSLPLGYIRDEIQPHAAVQGNLDPLLLVAGGEALDRRVDEIVETLNSGPFIFNLGHGIVPWTPVENVSRLVERIRT